jgi:adenine-specific DNA-methyltransferase
LEQLAQNRSAELPRPARDYQVEHSHLFQQNRLIWLPPQPWLEAFSSRPKLGDSFEVRQGMAENPPTISPRIVREFGSRYQAGEGVFVLSGDELERLSLSKSEQALLRPYYRIGDLGRYRLKKSSDAFLLYLTKQTAPSLSGLEHISNHLARFRPILDRRRETQNGRIAWWQLHWPREERIFTDPRILSLQMGEHPQFLHVRRATYVGFSVNVVRTGDKASFSLTVLTGILNSLPAKLWFERYAKRRGINVEINGALLRSFPLPPRNAKTELQLEALVEKRHALPFGDESPAESAHRASLEREIDLCVCCLYGVDQASVQAGD